MRAFALHAFAFEYVASHAKSDDVYIECFYEDTSDSSAFMYRDAESFFVVAVHYEDEMFNLLFAQQCASRSNAMLRLALFVADEYDEALDMRTLANAYS